MSRPTESGIEHLNPEELGELGKIIKPDDDKQDPPDCYLISYLTSPVSIHSRNTYVVFLNSDLSSKVKYYHWKASLKTNDGQIIDLNVEHDKEIAIFNYRFESYLPVIIEVILKDTNEETLKILQIIQECQISFKYLTKLLNNPVINEGKKYEPHNIAIGGHLETTREVFYDLFRYIKHAYMTSEDENKIPINFLISVIYLSLLRAPNKYIYDISLATLNNFISAIRFREDDKLITHLNNGISPINSDIYDSVGVAQLSLPTFAMISEDTFIDDQISDSTFENFIKIPYEKKIHFFNLLRFPKSNIIQCYKLLNIFKNNKFSYLSTNDFANNKEAIISVATEFEKIRRKGLKPIKFGKAVWNIMNSAFIDKILDNKLNLTASDAVNDRNDNSITIGEVKIGLIENPVRGRILFSNFGINQSQLAEDQKSGLDQLIMSCLSNLEYEIELIEGRASQTGNESNNIRLSIERANTVKQYLIENGIEDSKIGDIIGYGSTNPLDDQREVEVAINRSVMITWGIRIIIPNKIIKIPIPKSKGSRSWGIRLDLSGGAGHGGFGGSFAIGKLKNLDSGVEKVIAFVGLGIGVGLQTPGADPGFGDFTPFWTDKPYHFDDFHGAFASLGMMGAGICLVGYSIILLFLPFLCKKAISLGGFNMGACGADLSFNYRGRLIIIE